MPIRLTSDRTSLGRPNNPGRRSLLLKGEPCSGVTHQTYDYTDGKPIDPRDFSNFGGAKGSRTPDLLNAILKRANSLGFPSFPGLSKSCL